MKKSSNQWWISPEWESVLFHHHLQTWQDFWQLDIDLVDNPNFKGQGHSEVGRFWIIDKAQKKQSIYIKRQHHYCRRTLRAPFQGEPKLTQEFRMLNYLEKINIPAITPLAYGVHKNGNGLLVTLGLDDYQDLNQWRASTKASLLVRRKVLTVVAEQVRRLHEHRLLHNALYPKHILVKVDEVNIKIDARFIDLEGCRRSFIGQRFRYRDLSTLFRRASSQWTLTEKLYFFKRYLGIKRFDQKARSFWFKLIKYNG